MNTFTVNWKTTLAGLIGAIVTYTVTVVQTGNPWDWKAYAAALPLIVIGYFSKDKDTTGNGVLATKATL